ncbi:MAG: hypothetical protein JWO41_149 [Candidatus Saccharibacteria bacterium]|nr:hypothetical protein [Candidatus Saccharibacteria bacterium]
MESLNKLSARSKALIALVLFVGLIIMVVGLSHSGNKNKPAVDPKSGLYYDKNSGETVSNPSGKTPDTYGTTPTALTYLGFSRLLDYGLGSDQLTNVKYAFQDFSTKQNLRLTELSVGKDSVTAGRTSSDDSYLDFTVLANRKTTYLARILYADDQSITLTISDTNHKTVYTSDTLAPFSDGE